jgi:peptidyl-prolyl cis-trans isomerase D
MLQVIRDRAQGVFAWIIVGMISIPFALWGINSYFGGGGDDSIAEVNGIKISPRQVQSAYQQQRDRLQQMFGGKIPENLFSEEAMKKQILQQLIEKEILISAAASHGMRIGDRQLADTITNIDAFFRDGKFDSEQYERVLAQQGMSPRLFEQRVRRDLISNQLTEAVSNSEFTLEAEVDAHLSLQLQQRDIGYMVVPVSKYEANVAVSGDDLRKYYESNSARYMQPEQVKIDYLELKGADIASTIEVDDEEMRLRYETQKMNYRTPEERKASHILISVASGASDEEAKQAEDKAASLLQRINNGEDFAELAKAESQDPGSARNGGDLGFFGEGVMDPAFEKATFALQKGEVSELVRSAFGFHIIKLDDIKGGEAKTYEQVAAELKREIQEERAAEIFYDRGEQLANLTYEQPDTLSVAAEQLGLEIKSSGFFTRSGGSGIAANAKVSSAAFNEDVLVRGNNSETIEVGDNHLVVVRINEHKPEALRPFDEVKGEIETSLKKDKAREETLEAANSLFARLQAGENGETLANSEQLEWKQQSGLQRNNSELQRAIVQVAFRMPHPAEDGFSSEQLTLPGGDQALVALFAVKQGDANVAEATERSDAEQRLSRAAVNAAEQGLITSLREQAEITVKQ